MNPETHAVAPVEIPINNKRKKIVLAGSIAAGLILIILIAILAFLLSRDKATQTTDNSISYPLTESDSNTNTQENVSTPVSSDSTTNSDTKEFKGNFVTATIPSDWSIKEYSDQFGLSAFVFAEEYQFSGLTGLEIQDEKNNIVFSIGGVDGIGGSGGCSEVVQFADTESVYIEGVKEETGILGFEPTAVLDFTTKEYVPIFFLGKRFRRVDNKLYIATDENPTVFNTACGIGAQFIQITELGFTADNGVDNFTTNVYDYGIDSSINDKKTLEKLDNVLNTVKKTQ